MEQSAFLPEATSVTGFAVLGNPWSLLWIWLAVINLSTFCAFGIDKWKSKNPNRRRIPERNLFLGAIVGGSVGALLGMRVFRHKTLHTSFRVGIPVILGLQAAAAVAIFLWRTMAG